MAPTLSLGLPAKLLTKEDTELFLKMIKNRNFTSPIYKEEVAESISTNIPRFYKLMQFYTKKLHHEKN